MGKMDGVPQRFLQDHSGGNDCTADVSDRVWNGEIQMVSHGEPYLNFLIPGVVSLDNDDGQF